MFPGDKKFGGDDFSGPTIPGIAAEFNTQVFQEIIFSGLAMVSQTVHDGYSGGIRQRHDIACYATQDI